MVVVKMSHFCPNFATIAFIYLNHIVMQQSDQIIPDFTERQSGFLPDMLIGFRIYQLFKNTALALRNF